jgi:penicillin-binding protein 1A
MTRIEDKNGNVVARFDTQRKEVISQNTAYTMARMLQGPVDVGTAAGLRSRSGVSEMGGKTGTTNDNSDAWFIGFTPSLPVVFGSVATNRFIRLEGGLGYGGQAARPIWEYFFRKAFEDKTLGLDKQAKFVQPENMRSEMLYDYMNIQDQAPPGAEGTDEGNGAADEYLGTPSEENDVPVESKLSLEEQKVLKEANGKRVDTPKAVMPKQEEKKKKGFFKRLFGKKDKD